MRISLATFIIFLFTIQSTYAFQVQTNLKDTLFIKNANYQKLNKYISYHAIKEGKYTTNPKLMCKLRLVAIYHYRKNSYEVVKNDKAVTCKPGDIKQFTQSDKFANRDGFAGIFKINSQMEFVLKPGILKQLTICPKENNTKSIGLLMEKLRKQDFVSSISLDTLKDNPLAKLTGNKKPLVYIKVKLKPQYCNVKRLDGITRQLDTWKDVLNTGYTYQFFTGINEQDNIFEITSEIAGKGNKDADNNNPDPFKAFVDSLKKH
jgi:hypothetical protein